MIETSAPAASSGRANVTTTAALAFIVAVMLAAAVSFALGLYIGTLL